MIDLYGNFQSVLTIGAIELSSSQSEATSGPLFLSSLHCTEGDQSLLDDCYHDPLGLAVCDERFGLARAKCFGKRYCIYCSRRLFRASI